MLYPSYAYKKERVGDGVFFFSKYVFVRSGGVYSWISAPSFNQIGFNMDSSLIYDGGVVPFNIVLLDNDKAYYKIYDKRDVLIMLSNYLPIQMLVYQSIDEAELPCKEFIEIPMALR